MKNKFSNLKKIDFKDKKFIFPLVIVLILLFIGGFVLNAFKSMSKEDEAQSTEEAKYNEIQPVPLSQNQNIVSKSEAMSSNINSQDYTAIRNMREVSPVESDSTIYTHDEIAMLDSLEREANLMLEQLKQENQLTMQSNVELGEDKKRIGELDGIEIQRTLPSNSNLNEEMSLTEELILYQQLLNGEEILTPEQKQQRREEQIRADERQRIFEEQNKSDTYHIQKTTNFNSTAFNTIGGETKSSNQQHPGLFKAMIDETTKVESGSRIRIRLLEDIQLQGEIIPAGTHLYGIISGFQNQRVSATINNIILPSGKYTKVNIVVIDTDGVEGFYVPKSAFTTAMQNAASASLQGNNLNINSNNNSFESMAVQTLQNAYQSITQVATSNIRKDKAIIKYNTIIYLSNHE